MGCAVMFILTKMQLPSSKFNPFAFPKKHKMKSFIYESFSIFFHKKERLHSCTISFFENFIYLKKNTSKKLQKMQKHYTLAMSYKEFISIKINLQYTPNPN